MWILSLITDVLLHGLPLLERSTLFHAGHVIHLGPQLFRLSLSPFHLVLLYPGPFDLLEVVFLLVS